MERPDLRRASILFSPKSENRVRIIVEIFEGIRKLCGED
jgi:hypothetical protein